MYQHSQELHLATLKPVLWVPFFGPLEIVEEGYWRCWTLRLIFFSGWENEEATSWFIQEKYMSILNNAGNRKPTGKITEKKLRAVTAITHQGGPGRRARRTRMWGSSSWGLLLPLSMLYISNQLRGIESWVSSSKPCQDSQPHPLDPPDPHKVSQVPRPRNQKLSSYFPACPPSWTVKGKSRDKMTTVQSCHSCLWWGHCLGLGHRFRSWLYHILVIWLNLLKF